eukprot:7350849-Lingulodinium_polyedra.AAC.1
MYYATEERSKSRQQPTQQDMQKLKRLLRYAKGTFDYTYGRAPQLMVMDGVATDVAIYVDSDWA